MAISAKQEIKDIKAENFYFEFLSPKDDSIQLGKKKYNLYTFNPSSQCSLITS